MGGHLGKTLFAARAYMRAYQRSGPFEAAKRGWSAWPIGSVEKSGRRPVHPRDEIICRKRSHSAAIGGCDTFFQVVAPRRRQTTWHQTHFPQRPESMPVTV